MRNVLDEYIEEVQRAANESMDMVSKEAVQKLKSTSPHGKKGYARGWTRKTVKTRGISTFIVHNSKFGWLTHLLNNGHIIQNKSGTYGRKAGDNHIGNVESWANQEVENVIERNL